MNQIYQKIVFCAQYLQIIKKSRAETKFIVFLFISFLSCFQTKFFTNKLRIFPKGKYLARTQETPPYFKMSRFLKIGVVQMKVGHDKLKNIKHACQFIQQAAAKQADLVILPECFNSPYGTQYFHEYSELEHDSMTLNMLKEQLKQTPVDLRVEFEMEPGNFGLEVCIFFLSWFLTNDQKV